MNIKKLALIAMVLLPILGLAERSHAQRNFYCEDGIQAGSVLVAESGYIPGFVYGQTPGSSVNVRSNPNSDGSVIGTVQVGSAILKDSPNFNADPVTLQQDLRREWD